MANLYSDIINSKIKESYRKLHPLLDNKKNATYFTAILSILTLSFFGIFAIKPTITTAVSLQKEIGDLRALNDKYEEKITSIVRAQSEYEKIRDDIPLFFATLPDRPQFTKLIINEEQIASNSGMTLVTFQLDPMPISKTEEKKGLVTLNLSIGATGEYGNAYNFLTHFLRSQRVVSIADIDLSQDQATYGGKIRVSLKAKSYYEQ